MDLLTTINILEQLGHKELWICANTPEQYFRANSTYYNMHHWNNPTINRADGTILAQRVAIPDDWELVNGHKKIGTRVGSLPNPAWITPKHIYAEITEMKRIGDEKNILVEEAQPKTSDALCRRL
ncbi:hypothetical protein PEC311524_35360 [Pectobacterium carotovorum subsp. carotovorum]|uniref:hypothetical protein n=1 Tax=Pectobacterium polonicum TaxID=2485124 RepID=UPI00208BD12E|nr:hypothetical protein [Pectobacterium polonicum]GKW25942.1 hypothetical protein PEC311524_35360 [Pectobacterium carotovorum subsp. carotovorum]